MSTMASQITGVWIDYTNLCSGADKRKHQSSPSLAFVRGNHRSPVDYPHKGPATRNMFPFDDVTMSDDKVSIISRFSAVYNREPKTMHSIDVYIWETCTKIALCRVVVPADFTHILQGYFTVTGAILWLPQCQWSSNEGWAMANKDLLGNDYKTTTKQRKTKIKHVNSLW